MKIIEPTYFYMVQKQDCQYNAVLWIKKSAMLSLGHLKTSCDLLRSTFVHRHAMSTIHINDFSSETTGQILMKPDHNDHLMVRIQIDT